MWIKHTVEEAVSRKELLYVYSDSEGTIGALVKRSSSSPRMYPIVRMIVDLELRTGADIHLQWIASEQMIADKASRPDIDPLQIKFREECKRAVDTRVRWGPVYPGKRVRLDWDAAFEKYSQRVRSI